MSTYIHLLFKYFRKGEDKMGYIAPVTQFDYIQYANRTVAAESQANRSVQGISPIFPIKFYREMNTDRTETQRTETMSDQEPKVELSMYNDASIHKNYVSREVIEQTATELTGKGWFVNAMV